MGDVRIAIAITEARVSVDREDGDLISKIKTAMRSAKDHWMCTNENDQFIAAIGAVMEYYGKEAPEYQKLINEVENIRKFSAFLGAAQAGLSVDFPSEDFFKTDHEPLGLLKLWGEIKTGGGNG